MLRRGGGGYKFLRGPRESNRFVSSYRRVVPLPKHCINAFNGPRATLEFGITPPSIRPRGLIVKIRGHSRLKNYKTWRTKALKVDSAGRDTRKK